MAKNFSLSHRVTSDLRRDIVAGVLAPGAWLKTDELAARYGVSANPVREALWRLQGEGFVVANPNQGARVRTVDDDFVRNIFEIREAIEPIFVRRFCQRATPSDLDRLRAAAARLRRGGRRAAERFRGARSRQSGFSRHHRSSASSTCRRSRRWSATPASSTPPGRSCRSRCRACASESPSTPKSSKRSRRGIPRRPRGRRSSMFAALAKTCCNRCGRRGRSGFGRRASWRPRRGARPRRRPRQRPDEARKPTVREGRARRVAVPEFFIYHYLKILYHSPPSLREASSHDAQRALHWRHRADIGPLRRGLAGRRPRRHGAQPQPDDRGPAKGGQNPGRRYERRRLRRAGRQAFRRRRPIPSVHARSDAARHRDLHRKDRAIRVHLVGVRLREAGPALHDDRADEAREQVLAVQPRQDRLRAPAARPGPARLHHRSSEPTPCAPTCRSRSATPTTRSAA